MADKKDALTLIGEEQARQVSEEGYTAEHNAIHTKGELASAAIAYTLLSTGDKIRAGYSWPWEGKYFRPSDTPLRALVKAGALIAAEIDRIQNTSL